jgi:putative transposase
MTFPPERRLPLVRRLLDLRAAGQLSADRVRAAAQAAGVTERTVWRWLQVGEPELTARGWPRYRLSEHDRDAYAAWRGSAAGAWRELTAAGQPVPSLRTFQRAVQRDLLPIERAATRDGAAGRRRHTTYLQWEASYRNQLWQADHKELGVQVLLPKAHRPQKPWATLFLDAYSRLVMGWALDTYPSAATVGAALRRGLIVDLDRGPFGGVPDQLCWDNAWDFGADVIHRTAGQLAIDIRPTPPYTPHLKGKVERFNRTIAQEFLQGLPFYTDGPRAADGRLYGPAAPPMTLERFAAEFNNWVDAYNTRRPHSRLAGQTPLQRWLGDATPIREVPEEELRWLLLAGQQRKIGRYGIRFKCLNFIAPELHGRVGQQVEIRYPPHDPRKIEVFVGDDWLCTARPQGQLSAEERDAVLARRKADAAELGRRQRRASRQARLRLAPVTGPGEIEETTVISRAQAAADRSRRGDRRLRRLARADLLDLDTDPRHPPAGPGRPPPGD